MNIREVINARPDLVKYAVLAVLLIFGARYLMADSARRAEARAAEDHAEQTDSILDAAQERLALATSARVAAEEDTVRLSGLLKEARAAEAETRRQGEIENARLEERIRNLRVARQESSSGFRAELPEELRVPFDEHEAIHESELAAANETIRQRDETIRAADVFKAQLESTVVGLRKLVVEVSGERDEERGAKLLAIDARDAWHTSSDNYKAIVDRGLLSRLVGDLKATATAVAVGYAGAQFLGG